MFCCLRFLPLAEVDEILCLILGRAQIYHFDILEVKFWVQKSIPVTHRMELIHKGLLHIFIFTVVENKHHSGLICIYLDK